MRSTMSHSLVGVVGRRSRHFMGQLVVHSSPLRLTSMCGHATGTGATMVADADQDEGEGEASDTNGPGREGNP